MRSAWWRESKRLGSIDREYVVHVVRDHVWRFDTSPERAAERERSFAYQVEHLWSKTPTQERQHEHQPVQERLPTRDPTPERQQQRTQERSRGSRLGLVLDDEPVHGGVQVDIREKSHDRSDDVGWSR